MMTVTDEAFSTRFHPRVAADLLVKMRVKGRALSATATEISMAGVSLQGQFEELGESVTVAIPLPEDRQVITEAKVKRRAGGHVALEFAQLDWDDIFALARFLHPRLP